MPARSEKPAMAGSMAISAARGMTSAASEARSGTPIHASSSPTAALARRARALSSRSWPRSRPRVAPRAERMAISRARPSPRASMRCATLTQAMRSTSPTAASSASSGQTNAAAQVLGERHDRGAVEALVALGIVARRAAPSPNQHAARADSKVTPGASRATTLSQRTAAHMRHVVVSRARRAGGGPAPPRWGRRRRGA